MRNRFSIIYLICLGAAGLFYYLGYMEYGERDWAFAGLYALLCAFSLVILLRTWARNRYLTMHLKKVDKLSGEAFEEYLKAHFSKMGYRVKSTRATGDYGADLVLKKRGRITVVQAKRYTRAVGIAAVQEVIGAMAYYEADQGMVVTNQYFTKNAKNLAEQSGIELWGRYELKKQFGARE